MHSLMTLRSNIVFDVALELINQVINIIKNTDSNIEQNVCKAYIKINKIAELISIANENGLVLNKKEVKNLLINLLLINRALVTSYKSKQIDRFLDLMEFELIDNLQQWKIELTPMLYKEIRLNGPESHLPTL